MGASASYNAERGVFRASYDGNSVAITSQSALARFGNNRIDVSYGDDPAAALQFGDTQVTYSLADNNPAFTATDGTNSVSLSGAGLTGNIRGNAVTVTGDGLTVNRVGGRLANRAADIRAGLPSGQQFTPRGKLIGNIGIAEVNLPGLQRELKAFSQFQKGQNGFLPRPRGKTILPFSAPEGKISRDVDTEFKILENVARRFEDNRNASGSIDLFTERTPCLSCQRTISSFRELHPNIKLRIFSDDAR